MQVAYSGSVLWVGEAGQGRRERAEVPLQGGPQGRPLLLQGCSGVGVGRRGPHTCPSRKQRHQGCFLHPREVWVFCYSPCLAKWLQ